MKGLREIKIFDPSTTFRPDHVVRETNWNFRIYDEKSTDPRMKQVYNTYRQMHLNQTVEFVQNKVLQTGRICLKIDIMYGLRDLFRYYLERSLKISTEQFIFRIINALIRRQMTSK